MADWTDNTDSTGEWGDGACWALGAIGIFFGMPGLYIGLGISHRQGAYTGESEAEGVWSD